LLLPSDVGINYGRVTGAQERTGIASLVEGCGKKRPPRSHKRELCQQLDSWISVFCGALSVR